MRVNKNWGVPAVVTLTVVLGVWAFSRPDATPAEVCAEYYRLSIATPDPTALVELAKEAPPAMADDLLVLAGVLSGEVTAERASANLAAAC